MKFFCEDEVERLLPSADIHQYIEIKEFDKNYGFASCPECGSDMIVDQNRKNYFCPNCGNSGDLIDYIMKYHHINYIDAVKTMNPTIKKKMISWKEEKDKQDLLYRIHSCTTDFYVSKINQSVSKKYVKERQLSEQIIKDFKLGYSGPFNDDLYQYLIKKGFTDTDLLYTDIIYQRNTEKLKTSKFKNKYFDKFFDRLMFPIFDKNGKVIAFSGRTLTNNDSKYVNSSESLIFQKGDNLYGYHLAKKSKENFMILVEGNVDVIMMHQYGFTNTVASLGTALTPNQAKLLNKYQTIFIAYDNDEAGQKAIYKAIEIFSTLKKEIRVMNLAPYKDPDEFLKNLGAEEMKKRISEAIDKETFMEQYIANMDEEKRLEALEKFILWEKK